MRTGSLARTRENDAVLGTIARETEKRDVCARERGQKEGERSQIKKKERKKKEKGDGKERWTTKGRAWLERRDDGAGKGKEEKRHTHTHTHRRKERRPRERNGEEGDEGGREEAPRLSRPNELSGSGTKIIIEISCR